MFDWDEIEKSADRYHAKLEKVREELRLDACTDPIEVGSRVLVAGYLLGMGHQWVRIEGVVLECSSTSYKVRLGLDGRGENRGKTLWVHQDLITDVLTECREDAK